VRFFRLKGWTRIAVITTSDSSGQDAERGLDEVARAAENRDIVLVERARFDASDLSVAAQIERIRSAKPQALIAWATGASIATVYRGLTQAGLDLPVAPSTSTMVWAQIGQYEAFLPKQLYFATTEWVAHGEKRIDLHPDVVAEQKRFFSTIEAAGRQPDGVTEIGWDPPRLVIAALRKLGAGASAAQLRAHLAQVDRFAGIDGLYDFSKTPQRGLNIDNTVVARWVAGEKRWVAVSQPGGAPLDR
jgi:branched-chain amino acid transport system substrate-binding protein